MNYSFPSEFKDYDSWVEYTEDLRRTWDASRFWDNYDARDWASIFPEMENHIVELCFETENLLGCLKEDFTKTEELLSSDLNMRIFEEGLLDSTLGMTITRLEKKVKQYRSMLMNFQPKNDDTNYLIGDADIEEARRYPIINLIDQTPRRGFIKCPFHEEKTPSCKVFTDHLYCFGCGKYINTIGFVMETQGKSFINSVKYLCQK